jgi:hypothetical protein
MSRLRRPPSAVFRPASDVAARMIGAYSGRGVRRVRPERFRMSSGTDDTSTKHFHGVRFYKDAEGLSHIVATFLAEGFVEGQPAIVVATPLHLSAIKTALLDRGHEAGQLERDGELVLADASEMLDTFMVGGAPDAARFRASIVPIIQKAHRARPAGAVRVYGEMVDVLWKAGQPAAATRLETLWNMLATSHAFSLLCGYAMGSFYKDGAIEGICSQHSHVLSARGEATSLS